MASHLLIHQQNLNLIVTNQRINLSLSAVKYPLPIIHVYHYQLPQCKCRYYQYMLISLEPNNIGYIPNRYFDYSFNIGHTP